MLKCACLCKDRLFSINTNMKMLLFFFLSTFAFSCAEKAASTPTNILVKPKTDSLPLPYSLQLSEAALSLTKDEVEYDGTYFTIPYPGGDVPANKGVCTDVIIRIYRKLNVDLQKKVHEDMQANFALYPQKWGLKKTDSNIDHRRVPNLMTFFSRHSEVKKISQNPKDYQPGDIVTWNLPNGLTHIGMIVNQLSEDTSHFLVVHNIGSGQLVSDCLFMYEITGHYFYAEK